MTTLKRERLDLPIECASGALDANDDDVYLGDSSGCVYRVSKSGLICARTNVHLDRVNCLVSRSSRVLISCSNDGTVCATDWSDDRRIVRVLKANLHEAITVCCVYDDLKVVVATSSGRVCELSRVSSWLGKKSFGVTHVLHESSSVVHSLEISLNDKYVAWASSSGAYVIDLKTKERRLFLEPPNVTECDFVSNPSMAWRRPDELCVGWNDFVRIVRVGVGVCRVMKVVRMEKTCVFGIAKFLGNALWVLDGNSGALKEFQPPSGRAAEIEIIEAQSSSQPTVCMSAGETSMLVIANDCAFLIKEKLSEDFVDEFLMEEKFELALQHANPMQRVRILDLMLQSVSNLNEMTSVLEDGDAEAWIKLISVALARNCVSEIALKIPKTVPKSTLRIVADRLLSAREFVVLRGVLDKLDVNFLKDEAIPRLKTFRLAKDEDFSLITSTLITACLLEKNSKVLALGLMLESMESLNFKSKDLVFESIESAMCVETLKTIAPYADALCDSNSERFMEDLMKGCSSEEAIELISSSLKSPKNRLQFLLELYTKKRPTFNQIRFANLHDELIELYVFHSQSSYGFDELISSLGFFSFQKAADTIEKKNSALNDNLFKGLITLLRRMGGKENLLKAVSGLTFRADDEASTAETVSDDLSITMPFLLKFIESCPVEKFEFSLNVLKKLNFDAISPHLGFVLTQVIDRYVLEIPQESVDFMSYVVNDRNTQCNLRQMCNEVLASDLNSLLRESFVDRKKGSVVDINDRCAACLQSLNDSSSNLVVFHQSKALYHESCLYSLAGATRATQDLTTTDDDFSLKSDLIESSYASAFGGVAKTHVKRFDAESSSSSFGALPRVRKPSTAA